jgi:hypothetical protein
MELKFISFFPAATYFPETVDPIVYKDTLAALKKGSDSIFDYKEDYTYSEIIDGEYIMQSFDRKNIEQWLVELQVISSDIDEKEIKCVFKDKVTVIGSEDIIDPAGRDLTVAYYSRKNCKFKKL